MRSASFGPRGQHAQSSAPIKRSTPLITRTRVCFVLAAGLVLTAMAGSAYAQLSSEDIEALRQRGLAEGWTFTVKESEATRTPLKNLCGVVVPPDWQSYGRWDPCTPKRDLPTAYDWRVLGGCTGIRNQFQCGSCWAFSAVGPVESYLLIGLGLNRDLSEQWLVSCTGAGSCGGGWPSLSLEYLRCNGEEDSCGDFGAVLESDFPYIAADAPCGCPYNHPYCIPDWAYVGDGSGVPTVQQMKTAILDHGPISVCVSVNDAFQGYGGGVFNGCEDGDLNHAVVLVGWDDSQGPNGVWFMRNSWGSGWGEDGYMRIQYNCSLIGYAACFVDYNAESGSTTLPFSDSFTSASVDRSKWTGCTGSEVNDIGSNEPSPPYSLNLDGSSVGGDSVRTATIDSTNLADIILSYNWERKGGGDKPETGDDLIVEYFDNNENWVEIARYLGSGSGMSSYSPASHALLRAAYPSAFHDRLRFQFRVISSQVGSDDWFIDDVSIITTTDQVPPSGMQWVQQPTPTGTTSVAMSAFATDPSGVQYYFDASGVGSHSSGWQSGATYVDGALQVNRNYTYKVKARDLAEPIHNETEYTTPVALATFIETPTALSFGAITDNSIEVTAPGTFTRLTANMSGLFFEVTQLDGTPVGGGQANTWVQVQTITATGLTPGQTYRFRVKARNYYGWNETLWYPVAEYAQQPTTGGATCSLLGDMNGDGVVDGLDIDGFVRAKTGGTPLIGEEPTCANFGGTLEEDIAAFIEDLLGLET